MPVRESTSVRVLLISRHIETIETLCHFMQQMMMHVESCCDVELGLPKLCREKFEGIVVDLYEKQAALGFLRKLRELTSHRSAVSCAILNHSHERAEAFQAGANFVLERPLSLSAVVRTLRAAYPLMIRERRRYFRCPVQTPTYMTSGSGPEIVANSVNISEAGIAIVSPVAVRVGERLQLRLRLPARTEWMMICGEVCWTDPTGRTGMQFVSVPTKVTQTLQGWLSERLEEMMPVGNSETRVDAQ